MENLYVALRNSESVRYYAFTYSLTGQLDYAGKVESPELFEYHTLEASTYFSPSWYEFISQELQCEIQVLYRESEALENPELYSYLLHIGAVLAAVESGDSLLVAELLGRRKGVFSAFLPLTLYILKPIAPLALFSALYGTFSGNAQFLEMYKANAKLPSDKSDPASILFAAAYESLSPKPEKETPEAMFIRYFQEHRSGSFTLALVGTNFHHWDDDIDLLERILQKATVESFARNNQTNSPKQKRSEFFESLKVSVQAEPYNLHDSNAIGVSIESIQGKLYGNGGISKAGYIRATGAAILRAAFPKNVSFRAQLFRLNSHAYGNAQDGIVIRISL